MLKLTTLATKNEATSQPPSGGCVLKLNTPVIGISYTVQPPSGGCVLKQTAANPPCPARPPAAFRRLCVETRQTKSAPPKQNPAAFRRLCVETMVSSSASKPRLPAAFRRLCVETAQPRKPRLGQSGQPPSGGCVLKPASWRLSS